MYIKTYQLPEFIKQVRQPCKFLRCFVSEVHLLTDREQLLEQSLPNHTLKVSLVLQREFVLVVTNGTVLHRTTKMTWDSVNEST